eukprot:Mycagemm_TRINITY_DN10283_c0_g3::TRINITY_DN10283_c0_g3_i1::g.3900::m.3900 type:complete len:164 gc:universal TRINITY_DN10283_c0_g3_i1:576-85(-)
MIGLTSSELLAKEVHAILRLDKPLDVCNADHGIGFCESEIKEVPNLTIGPQELVSLVQWEVGRSMAVANLRSSALSNANVIDVVELAALVPRHQGTYLRNAELWIPLLEQPELPRLHVREGRCSEGHRDHVVVLVIKGITRNQTIELFHLGGETVVQAALQPN